MKIADTAPRRSGRQDPTSSTTNPRTPARQGEDARRLQPEAWGSARKLFKRVARIAGYSFNADEGLCQLAASPMATGAMEAAKAARHWNRSEARRRPTGSSETLPGPGHTPVSFSKVPVSPADGFEGRFGGCFQPLPRTGTLAPSSVGGLVRHNGARSTGSHPTSRCPEATGESSRKELKRVAK